MDPALCCWIVLSPSLKDYDEFTVMVGWSKYGRYPETGVIPCVSPTPDHAEFSETDYLIRLPQLWSGEDFWVVKPFKAALTMDELQASIAPITRQEAETLVLPQVEAAFGKLMDTGLPYLRKYMAFRGLIG